MHFSTATIACALPLLAAAFEFPDFVPLHKRQEPGTPAYECHANCGGVITLSRTDGFCDTSDFTTKFNACMACAVEYDIWQYYGSSVTRAANTCGVEVNLSSSASAEATTAAPSTSAAAVTTAVATTESSEAPETTSSAAPASTPVESSAASSTVAATSSAAVESSSVEASSTSAAASVGVSTSAVPTVASASSSSFVSNSFGSNSTTLATVTPTPTPSATPFDGAATKQNVGGVLGAIVLALGLVVV